MSIEVDQKQFISSYLQLVSLSENQDPSYFNDINGYGRLSSLGPSLPSVKGVLPSSSTTADITTVKLSFKSIKPPFKFQVDLEDIPDTESIFNVKIKLIDTLKLNEQNVKPKDIKLLIKGKVIQDSEIVANLSNHSLMCMISQTTSAATDDPEPSIPETTGANMDIDLSITEETWAKIHELLKHDLKNEERASEILSNFKKSV